MGGVVLLPETFKWSDVVVMEVLTCLVHPHHRSLPPSTVFNALVSVITLCAPAGVHINCLSEAWECCSSSSKYCLCRTAVPFSWCLQALFRFESHESPCVTPITCQHFSVHHNYWHPWVGANWSCAAWNASVSSSWCDPSLKCSHGKGKG